MMDMTIAIHDIYTRVALFLDSVGRDDYKFFDFIIIFEIPYSCILKEKKNMVVGNSLINASYFVWQLHAKTI